MEIPIEGVSDHRNLFNELTKAYMEMRLLEPKSLWREMKSKADEGQLAGALKADIGFGMTIFGFSREKLLELMYYAAKELNRGETICSGQINVTKLTYKHARFPEIQVDITMPRRRVKSFRSFIVSLNPASGQPLLRSTAPTDFREGRWLMPSLDARRRRP